MSFGFLSFIIGAFVAINFAGCQKYVEFKVPIPETKPVLNCLFEQDSAFTIRVSLSMSMYDSREVMVENAVLKLFADGELVENIQPMPDSAGFYKSAYKAKPEIEYTIIGYIEGFAPISATDKIPYAIIPKKYVFERAAVINPYGGSCDRATVTFVDPASETNYYGVLIYAHYFSSFWGETNNIIDFCNWQYNDPVLIAENIATRSSPFFSDQLFNGQEYTMEIPIGLIDESEEPEHYFFFEHLSPAFYQYRKSVTTHLDNQEGEEVELFIIDAGNPVSLYSNIENGYGIFAGKNAQRFKITDIQ